MPWVIALVIALLSGIFGFVASVYGFVERELKMVVLGVFLALLCVGSVTWMTTSANMPAEVVSHEDFVVQSVKQPDGRTIQVIVMEKNRKPVIINVNEKMQQVVPEGKVRVTIYSQTYLGLNWHGCRKDLLDNYELVK